MVLLKHGMNVPPFAKIQVPLLKRLLKENTCTSSKHQMTCHKTSLSRASMRVAGVVGEVSSKSEWALCHSLNTPKARRSTKLPHQYDDSTVYSVPDSVS